MFVYRGTQRPVIEGHLKGMSFTDSLAVAVIWSARPGDVWLNRKTQFLETSTVHVIDAQPRNVLVLGGDEPNMSLGEVLRALQYPSGITPDEVLKIFNYLHKRLLGRAAGGEFKYLYVNDEGVEYTDDDLEFSLIRPQTMISKAKEDWEGEYEDFQMEIADNLYIDTFAFADSPAVQRAAIKLGYDAIAYEDVFAGGKDASEELLGIRVDKLTGVRMGWDPVDSKRVPTHTTLRVLDESAIKAAWSFPTKEVLAAPWSIKR